MLFLSSAEENRRREPLARCTFRNMPGRTRSFAGLNHALPFRPVVRFTALYHTPTADRRLRWPSSPSSTSSTSPHYIPHRRLVDGCGGRRGRAAGSSATTTTKRRRPRWWARSHRRPRTQTLCATRAPRPVRQRSGSLSTVLTVLSWICAGIYMCGALPSPVCA